MFKRFLKDNLLLVTVIAGSAVTLVVLLVVALVKHAEMNQNIETINNMRTKIHQLQAAKIAPVEENIDLLKQDEEFYRRKKEEVYKYFGHPFADAFDQMARALGLKDGEEFKRKFREFREKQSVSNREQLYQRFKVELGSRQYQDAVNVFKKAIRPKTVEEISDRNVDGIVLAFLGFPRTLSPGQYAELVQKFQEQLRSELSNHKVVVDQAAGDLGMAAGAASADGQIGAEAIRNLDIIGDIVRRVAASNVSRLEGFELSDKGERDGFIRINLKIRVVGTLDSIRELVKLLNSAVEDNRVYLVQYAMLRNDVDEAANVLAGIRPKTRAEIIAEEKAEAAAKAGAAAGAGENAKVQEVPAVDESKLPYYERSDYGLPLLGSSDKCHASIDVEYLIFPVKD